MSAAVPTGRVGFFTGRQLVVDDGALHGEPGIARVVDELATRVDLTVAACSPATREPRHSHRLVHLPPDRLRPLPPMSSITAGIPHPGAPRATMAALEAETDLTVVQLSFQSPLALWPQGSPRLYHLFGDVAELARVSTRYGGARRIPAVALGRAVQAAQQALVRRPRVAVLANGEVLAAKYPSASTRSVVSSTLLLADLPSELPARGDRATRLLFVGYARPEKGFDVLVDAFERLEPILPDLTLRLVVRGELSHAGPGVAERVDALVARGRAEVLGELAFGPALFDVYRSADVLVLPSRSEGTPRVLVEGRAFGCAVVSTRVGGIPSSVTDGVDGLLVEPDDPDGLAAAIHRVVTDDGLRRRLVTEGFERARTMTVEGFVDELCASLAALERGAVPEAVA